MWGDAPGRVWSLMGKHSFDLLLKFWPLEPATSVGEGSGKGGDERVEAARVGERGRAWGPVKTQERETDVNREQGVRQLVKGRVRGGWGRRTGGQEMLRADRGAGPAGAEKGTGLRGIGREAQAVSGAPASSLFCPGVWVVCRGAHGSPPLPAILPHPPRGGISLVSSANGWCLMFCRFQQVSGQGFTEGIKWPKGWGQGEASSSHPEVS